MASASTAVKIAFHKWKSTAKKSSPRTIYSDDETTVDSGYTQSFQSLDTDMLNDSDDMSSSVTTSSSTR